ncbi:uncharacterized protein LOC131937462 [Physella acuta]|uniref:uncharacterized protein LOC131937462 n=1 Tax=Physella acuta TaxID=109671 RepID=UPI0027DC33A9|nr:uncharacterized protein LOC131937462 [Physella acuta]
MDKSVVQIMFVVIIGIQQMILCCKVPKGCDRILQQKIITDQQKDKMKVCRLLPKQLKCIGRMSGNCWELMSPETSMEEYIQKLNNFCGEVDNRQGSELHNTAVVPHTLIHDSLVVLTISTVFYCLL